MSQDQCSALAAETQIRNVISTPRSHARKTNDTGKENAPPRFEKVLQQLQIDAIPSLATLVRQSSIYISGERDGLITTPSPVGCKVDKEAHNGSFNIAYQINFDDGVRWMLKIPASGHPGCWDSLAAQALTSEAHTMRVIKDRTDVPVPTVHRFDASMDNEIGCPYILMDRVEGILLNKAWFDVNASQHRQESVRLKALQTIAAAMVELSQLKFAKGGAFVDDSMDVASIRAADNHKMFNEIRAGNKDVEELYCAKGPMSNPLSQIPFMIRRGGIKNQDQALDRGGFESLDLLTRWASEYLDVDHEDFVLAHPDLDSQNIFVKEDGTLCGIIDWDGTAAVPYMVGALKYPLWLARDWDPTFYNYDPETEEQISPNGRKENSPEELGK